jgi:nucleoside-diphosphate-sugar epimerase
LPSGDKYLQNRIQFIHIDDVARLIAYILNKNEPEGRRLTILNVAGRGGPLTYEQCVRLAKAKLVRVPSEKLFALVLRILWAIKLSTIPPDVAPYMTSDTVMNTARLEEFLGREYENVIRLPIADAFAECFRQHEPKVQAAPAGKA